MKWKLQWGPNGEQAIHSVAELDDTLDRLSREAVAKPYIAVLMAGDGASLGIGLGRETSVANFVSAGGEPPHFQSRGTASDDEADIVFFFGGDWSDFPASSGIPIEVARAAMRAFFANCELPKNVQWKEV